MACIINNLLSIGEEWLQNNVLRSISLLIKLILNRRLFPDMPVTGTVWESCTLCGTIWEFSRILLSLFFVTGYAVDRYI